MWLPWRIIHLHANQRALLEIDGEHCHQQKTDETAHVRFVTDEHDLLRIRVLAQFVPDKMWFNGRQQLRRLFYLDLQYLSGDVRSLARPYIWAAKN